MTGLLAVGGAPSSSFAELVIGVVALDLSGGTAR